jgi:hypothetical protein
MKYCKICKTTAKETDTLCAKGHPLSVFGAKPASTASPSPKPTVTAPPTPGAHAETPKPSAVMFTLLGEVQKLEEAKQKNVKRSRAFALLSLGATLAIVLLLYTVYARTVLSFAVLENVRVEQNPSMDLELKISYEVKTPGKVAFDRQSGTHRLEKIDQIAESGPKTFRWLWPSDSKTGIEFRVHYRDGWFLKSFDRHFDVRDRSDGFF